MTETLLVLPRPGDMYIKTVSFANPSSDFSMMIIGVSDIDNATYVWYLLTRCYRTSHDKSRIDHGRVYWFKPRLGWDGDNGWKKLNDG